MTPERPVTGCLNPPINEYATPYCFGDATEEQRDAFSAHLLECDYCWEEVQRLEAAIRVLRSDPEVVGAFAANDVINLFGLSARLEKWFGGHWPQLAVAVSMYSLLFPLALLAEVAYDFDRLGRPAVDASPFMFVWIAVTSLAAFAMVWHGSRTNARAKVVYAGATLLIAPVVLFLGVRGLLPSYPVVQANFQTYTAQAGFLKSIVLTVPLAILFLMIPFDFILTLQRQLREGRHAFVLDMLNGASHAVPPKGALYLRPKILLAALVIDLVFSILGTIRLFEGLTPSPQMNLFMILTLARSFLYVTLWVGAWWWYTWALNEVKRECVAVTSIGLDRSLNAS